MPLASSQPREFTKTLESDAANYGVDLTTHTIDVLLAYYNLLNSWNPRLHLVAPCEPKEFARRHVLESLLLLPHLPHAAKIADIGSGAGLPMIPCLIARSDIRATLIESSKKKSVFLLEALNLAGKAKSATLVAERFEEIKAPDVECVTCRALERFNQTLPSLIKWAPPESTLLLFGGPELRREIETSSLNFKEIKIPNSQRRFLFVVKRG